MNNIYKLLTAVLIAIIRFYRYFISPMLPPSCRFQPTCSEYTIDAIHRHGINGGIWLALKRLSRCHPGCPGGFDPVPQHQEKTRLI